MKIKLMPMLGGLVALSLATAPFIIKAQAETPDQPAPAQTTHQHHQGKWDQLNLTDAQKQQLRQIGKETHDQIQAVLTSDQQAQLKAAMQNHQAGQAHQGRQNLWASLNLTDDQKAKIKAIKDAQKARMQALLTPAQQQQLQQMQQQWQQKRQQRQNNQQGNQ